MSIHAARAGPAAAATSPPKVELSRPQALDPPDTQTKSKSQASRRGGRKSRDKGDRAERTLVKYFQDHGLPAERVPLSGSVGGSYLGDLGVPLLGVDRVVEVKARANGFRELYRWLERRDALIVKADRREALAIVRVSFAAEVMKAAERSPQQSATVRSRHARPCHAFAERMQCQQSLRFEAKPAPIAAVTTRDQLSKKEPSHE